MDKLNTNVRSLKRIPGPDVNLVYTMETKVEQGKRKILCDHCGKKDAEIGYTACDIHARLMNQSNDGVGVIVRACPSFQPPLTFRPPLKGFDGEFNTFRLGTAWYYRIGSGVIAALVNSLNGTIFGKAEVLWTEIGTLAQMCEEYAASNHSMLHVDPLEAPERMRKVLRQSYGLIEVEDDMQVTVIHLRNLHGKEGALER